MPFLNTSDILIKKSNNTIIKITIDNNIKVHVLDNNFNETDCFQIFDGKYSFLDVYFDVDIHDNIYGLIDNKQGKIINLYIKDNKLKKDVLFKYDYKKFYIKSPYIKYLDNNTHIMYLSLNQDSSYLCSLIHIYKDDKNYIKSNIDFLEYNILNNFIVIFNNHNEPMIFYFNIVDGFEELFMSTFDLNILTWTKPLQLTSSKKNKIYLSVIKGFSDDFHISFSEKHDHKYYCFYMNISIKNSNFNINTSQLILTNIMCLFPTLIQYKSNLHIQFVEYHDLYYCSSIDNGKNFTIPSVCDYISNSNFIKNEYRYHDSYTDLSMHSLFIDKDLIYLNQYHS